MDEANDAPHTCRDRFVADHRRLEELLVRIVDRLEAGDAESVPPRWAEFFEGLVQHLGDEERLVMPDLLRTSPQEARVIHEEHRHIRARAVEIGRAVVPRNVRADAMSAFLEEVRAHTLHEDAVLDRWADGATRDPHSSAPFRVPGKSRCSTPV